MSSFAILICTLLLANNALGFIAAPKMKAPRVKPIHENFFLDIAEDPVENTPKEIFGEVAYKSFVESYNEKGSLIFSKRLQYLTNLFLLNRINCWKI